MKVTKKILAIAMATVMVFSTSALTMSVSAAKWVKSDNGIMYQYDNGSYAKNKWIKTKSGDRYYIKADGTRATGWTEIDGDMYYFNKKTGKATINKKIVIGSYSYKFDKNGVWTGIVYSKDGKKNVTKSVNVAKLTGQTSSTSSNKTASTSSTTKTTKKVEGKIPATVKINGKTYNTSATNTFIGSKADAVYPKGNGENSKFDRNSKWGIDISGCSDKDLEVLKYFTNIKSLTLVDHDTTSTITNLDFCQYMPNLERIYVDGAVNLTDVSGLGACSKLNNLQIGICKLTNLDGLESLKNIKEVAITHTWLDNVDGLVNCTKLETVELTWGRLTDISALKGKTKIKTLTLSHNRRLKDISALESLTGLKKLYMNACTSVNTWASLTKIKNLESVALNFNVLGSKGPYGYVTKLENNGVKVTYDSNVWLNGKHPMSKETANSAAWDAKYRPATVHGDDKDCKSGCKDCVLNKNNETYRNGID